MIPSESALQWPLGTIGAPGLVPSPPPPQLPKVEGGSDSRSVPSKAQAGPYQMSCVYLSASAGREGGDPAPAGMLVRASPTLQGLNNVFLP